MSTPRSRLLPDQVTAAVIETSRGRFAALVTRPARGVCERLPALLIPGYTGSKEDFVPVLPSLASAGRVVVAADLRGQYQSPRAASPAGYAPGELAADVTALADAVGHDDGGIHLAGHSMGGLVARQAVLADQAAAAASLALIGSGPGQIGGARAGYLRDALARLGVPAEGDLGVQAASLEPRLRARIRRLADEFLGVDADTGTVDMAEVAFLRRRFLDSSPVGLAVMARNLLSWPDQTAELAELVRRHRLPVLVLYGEDDDAWAPGVQDEMAARLGAQRICIPGAAHSPAMDAPETTAASLTQFWNAAERQHRQPGAPPAEAAR